MADRAGKENHPSIHHRQMITSKAYWLFLGGAVCLILGTTGTVLGIKNLQIALRYSKTPQEITYADLIAHGPGENVHIVLTDFTPCREGAVVHPGQDGKWFQVYLPVGPANRTGPLAAGEIGAILVLRSIHDDKELDRAVAWTRLTGIVESQGGFSHSRELQSFNPGIALNQCWEIVEEHNPWSVLDAIWAMVFSLPGFALGGYLFVRAAIHYSNEDQRTQGVMFVMSPLLLVVGTIHRWSRGRFPASASAKAMLLVASGLCLLVLGGVLIYQFLLLSFRGPTGSMVLGTFSLDIGFALFAVGSLSLLRQKEEPGPSETARVAIDPSRIVEQGRF
jgi:hypothetical protein